MPRAVVLAATMLASWAFAQECPAFQFSCPGSATQSCGTACNGTIAFSRTADCDSHGNLTGCAVGASTGESCDCTGGTCQVDVTCSGACMNKCGGQCLDGTDGQCCMGQVIAAGSTCCPGGFGCDADHVCGTAGPDGDCSNVCVSSGSVCCGDDTQCPAGAQCCKGSCIAGDLTCCDDGTTCAGSENCAGGRCCPKPFRVYDGSTGYCCGDLSGVIDGNTLCQCVVACNGTCCPSGTACCARKGWCAPTNECPPPCPASLPTSCDDGSCAPAGAICCGNNLYCPNGLSCVDSGGGVTTCGSGPSPQLAQVGMTMAPQDGGAVHSQSRAAPTGTSMHTGTPPGATVKGTGPAAPSGGGLGAGYPCGCSGAGMLMPGALLGWWLRRRRARQ